MDPRTFIAGQTKRVTVLSGQATSSEAEWGKLYAFFKITPMDDTGIPAATTIDLLINSKLALVNDGTLQMTYPDEDFVWFVTPMGGADNIRLRLGGNATQNVVFQITPFEESAQ